jgi:NAD(P)-dependent dehydrogenase (short-subunit alcohol dehydrogenase family)
MKSPVSGQGWLGLDCAKVLVAGGGGIGSACAEGYARQGAKVVLVDRDTERLTAATEEIRAKVPGCTLEPLTVDLTVPGSGRRVVSNVIERLGGLDVALHAIGINDRRPILDFTSEEWSRILRVNLDSVFELVQSVGRHMVAMRRGRIVMLSSVSGLLAHEKHGPYAASKGGLNQLMRVMAREWAPSGVTVNAVAPGYIETNLTAAHLAKPGVREGLVELVPAGRLGAPEEVVGPVLFLSSEHASFVTGQVLFIDGGRTLV